MTWLTLAWAALKPLASKAGAVLARVPWYVWVTAVALATIWIHLGHDQTAKAEAYARGRAETLAGAHFDSTLLALTDSTHAAKRAHTDTVIKRVRGKAAKVDSQAIVVAALASFPQPKIDSFPEVQQLKAQALTLANESKRLVGAVDSLTRTLSVERDASTLLVSTLRGQLTQSRLETGREHDMVIALQKRPTRLHEVGSNVVTNLLTHGLRTLAGKR
jgi:hypothetical protein